MFPGKDLTSEDHYRFNAGKWMVVAGLDPYVEKDCEMFRDAVLGAMPTTWQEAPHAQSLINIIRAWNPSLASIERNQRPAVGTTILRRRFVRS